LGGPCRDRARARLAREKAQGLTSAIARREPPFFGHDLTAARRTAHPAAGAEPEPGAASDVVDRSRPLVAYDMAHFRFDDGLACAHDDAFFRSLGDTLCDDLRARAVTVDEARRGDGVDTQALG
jgi:hypothetical protein